MTSDEKNETKKKQQLRVLTQFLLTRVLKTCKEFGILGKPEEIGKAWFTTSYSLFQMVLQNTKEVSKERYEHIQSEILTHLERMKNELEKEQIVEATEKI